MIDLAKLTGIINGKWEPLCVLGVSPKFVYTNYNQSRDAVTITNYGARFEDDGIYFDVGENDYVNCGNDSRYDFTEFTIVFRFKTISTSGGVLLGKNHNTSFYVAQENTGALRFWTNGSSLYINKNLNDGVIHYAGFTFKDGTRTAVIDVDSTYSGAGTLSTDTNNILLGKSESNPSYFKGMMDDVFIFNKAFSVDQIKAIHKFLGA